jgi:hypothetical protein
MNISGSKYLFDVFIAVDFSGSKDPRQQKKHIAFAETEHGLLTPRISRGLTRSAAISHLIERLRYHDSQGKRVLCGYDFQYSFPAGFWRALTNLPEIWSEMIQGISEGVFGLPKISEEPASNAREWAEVANNQIVRHLGSPVGPFWGPNFSPAKDPGFFHYLKTPFDEYRLVEKRLPGCKPIFKIGGQGSVGLQSLCGIPCLFRIRTVCSEQNIPLHFWPFDGWDCGGYHVIVEWYPTIHNRGRKSDEKDACACVEWAKSADEGGTLSHYFSPRLSTSEEAHVTFEGWVLGVL